MVYDHGPWSSQYEPTTSMSSGVMLASSYDSRNAPSIGLSLSAVAPPGMPHVPPSALHTARCCMTTCVTSPVVSLRRAKSTPDAPFVPQCLRPQAQSTQPSPGWCTFSLGGSGFAAPVFASYSASGARSERVTFHRSVHSTPNCAARRRANGRLRPMMPCGSPSIESMNAPPKPSKVNDPATSSGSPVAM